jgi:hypothetical protein
MRFNKIDYNLYKKIDKQWKPFVCEEIVNYIYVYYFSKSNEKQKQLFRLKINPDKLKFKQ